MTWDLALRRQGGIDLIEKLEQLLVAMLAMTATDDLPGRHIQRGTQRRRAVPKVVVGLARRDPGAHGQQGARPIQRLHLALLVQTDHDRMVGRIQIQADDVAHLLDKLRVGRELERVDAMRLQPEGLPDARDGRLRQARDLRHGARAPLRRGRRRLQRPGE
jgi:hypothetical protein